MKCLIDTSAFVALVMMRDQFHGRAREFLRTKNLQLITNVVIMGEVYTHLHNLHGYNVAMDAHDRFVRNGSLTIVPWDERRDGQTYSVLRRLRGLPLSYEDASLMTLGEDLGLDTVFGFDSDFRLAGFTVLPD